MNRKEQIEQAAINHHAEFFVRSEFPVSYESFVMGAEWADANNKDAEIQFELTKQNKYLQNQLAVALEALEHYVNAETLTVPHDWSYAKMGGAPDTEQLEKEDIGYVAREALDKIKGDK